MPHHNPYIEKVLKHPNIQTDIKELSKNKWNWKKYFWNSHPVRLEIWTGLWNFFSNEVSNNSEINFLWMEIKYKRCFSTAEKTLKKWGKNFLVIKEYAQKLDEFIADGELQQVYIFFPDPWARKDRQRKHRVLQKEFLALIHKKLEKWGRIIFKTDHIEYFEDTLEILDELDLYDQEFKSFDYEKELTQHFDKWNMTEFEVIFREDKIKVCYIELIKK